MPARARALCAAHVRSLTGLANWLTANDLEDPHIEELSRLVALQLDERDGTLADGLSAAERDETGK